MGRSRLPAHPAVNPTGALHIQIHWDGREVLAVDIASTRPSASQMLSGLPVASAMSRIPMLYSICRRAQGCAAQAALAAARGQLARIEPQTASAILCEMTQEHLWRLLLDWPRLLGLDALEQEFSLWYRRLAASAKAGTEADMQRQLAGFGDFIAAAVLGMPWAAWLKLENRNQIQPDAALAGRLWHALRDQPKAGKAAVCWLPMVTASEFSGICASAWNADFERHPHWQGEAAETGSLARWRTQPLVAAVLAEHGRGVSVRLLARLMDLAQCAGYIAAPDEWFASNWIDAFSPLPGVGMARVETARGTLWHRLRLEGEAEHELINEYSVVAPTEWNFHPRGAFVAALSGIAQVDEAALQRIVRKMILALDPCVPCQLEICHA